jgi:outer membrane protein OmpA-like peptidoglycan-associated protein
MNRIKLLILSLFFSAALFSQNYLGLVNNNYGAFNAVMFNPAMGNRTFISIQPAAFDVNFYNNYVYMDSVKLFKLLRDSDYADQYSKGFKFHSIKERLNGRDKYVNLSADVRGPSILLGFKRFQVGYFYKRARFGLQISGVSEQLARNLFYIGQSDVIDVSNVNFRDNKFAINMNAWTESGITGAYSLEDTKYKLLRFGITIKQLNGLGAFYIRNRGTNFEFYKPKGKTSTDSILYANYDVEAGITNEFSYDPRNFSTQQMDTFTGSAKFDQNIVLKNFLTNKRSESRLGKGTSIDLGVVYEKRMGKKSRYQYRLAASIIDLGAITYSNYSYVVHYQGSNAVTISNGIRGNNSRMYDTAIATRFKATPGSYTSFTLGLPTTLNVSADYSFTRNVFVNATWIQSVRGRYTEGIRSFSSLSLSPRFESKVVSFTIPLVLNDDYRSFNMGLCLSLGNCIYIGSDDIGGLFSIGKLNGFDLYGGAAININKHKKKKKAPVEKNIDTDKDGIVDKDDECPNEPGLAVLKGCPDRDNDGVADKDDRCPDVAGTMHGCPDTDKDGVADIDDRCPNIPGTIAMHGCPDHDSDGVADTEDECPDIPGLLSLKGCPDFDKDGVADKDDPCPKEYGRSYGCPDMDSDGIADKDDKCPEKAGTAEMKGCPDSDGDGINDADDQCPLVKGTKENFGCPPKEKDVVKVDKVDLDAADKKAIEEAFKFLEFESGKSTIKSTSVDGLDNVAEILVKHPEYRLLIVGHTDNVGNAAYNKALSLARAEAVKAYLVKKGIAANRFIVKGYGSERPAADNNTPEGRQANRRVEMTVVK